MPEKIKSSGQLLRGIASGLRTAATRPTIHGYQPHAKQLDFHRSQARGRLFIGGNRSGKTVGGGSEMVNKLMGRDPYKAVKHQPPVECRAVGVDFDHGIEKIVKPQIARWLPPSALQNGSWEESYDKSTRTLTLENGSSLEFMSYDQDVDKFAGTSRHYIWFDEEPPEEIFNECMMRLIDTSGDYWVTMTPVEGMTWVYDRLYMAAKTDENIHVTEVMTDENPHINPGEIDILTTGLTDDDKKARREGKFVQIGGLIYKMLDERHFLEDVFIPPKEWMHFEMMDAGFSNPTCWLWGAVNRDGTIIIYDEWYKAGEIVSVHAAAVAEKRLEHLEQAGVVTSYSVGDPSIRNTDPISGTSVHIEYMDCGIAIILGNNDQKAGIMRVAQKLTGTNGRPQLFIVKNKCPNLSWELPRLRWATWANKTMDNKKNRKEEQHKKNDHSPDALRYGVASRPQLDDGGYVPENPDSRGYSKADSPYDESLVSVSADQSESSDYNMGSEW